MCDSIMYGSGPLVTVMTFLFIIAYVIGITAMVMLIVALWKYINKK